MSRNIIASIALAVVLTAAPVLAQTVTWDVDPTGSGDFTTIQAAIDALPATLADNYIIQIHDDNGNPYTYIENPIVQNKTTAPTATITFEGVGDVTVQGSTGVDDNVFTVRDVNYVTFRDLKVVGSAPLRYEFFFAGQSGPNLQVRQSRVEGCSLAGPNGILLRYCHNSWITHNYIEADTWGIVVIGNSMNTCSTLVANNMIRLVPELGNLARSAGIRLETHSTDLWYNTLFCSTNCCVYDTAGWTDSRCNIYVNLALDMNGCVCYRKRGMVYPQGLASDFNCFHRPNEGPSPNVGDIDGGPLTWAAWTSGPNNYDWSGQYAGPALVSPWTGDLHLTATSGCVDAGTPLWAITDDIDDDPRPHGAGPDIGADERTGWILKEPLPTSIAYPSRKVKAGGWLAVDQDLIYAARGNDTRDFYRYDMSGWTQLPDWPDGAEGRRPKKGSRGCADGQGHIYATKGHNTPGFWMYGPGSGTWQQLADVPLGPTAGCPYAHKVKCGTDIVYAEGAVYLLKGYRNQFWRYDVAGNSWSQCDDVPAVPNDRWKEGSWLAYDPVAKVIYAHKARYVSGIPEQHYVFTYDVVGGTWDPTPLKGMPRPGTAGNKTSTDGGCGVYDDNGGIWALKGHKTGEFW